MSLLGCYTIYKPFGVIKAMSVLCYTSRVKTVLYKPCLYDVIQAMPVRQCTVL